MSCTVGCGRRRRDLRDLNDSLDPFDSIDPLDPLDSLALESPMSGMGEDVRVFTYRIDPDLSVVFLIYGTRQPTFAEWRDGMDALLADPALRMGMAIVSDRRRLTEAPSTPVIQRMVAYEYEHRDRFGECRWAVVIDPEARAEFGMARMSQAMLEGGRSRVTLRPFTDMDRAVRWATTGVDEE